MKWLTHHFNVVLWLHFCEALLCERGKVGLDYHESATDIVSFHSLCKGFYCFYANFVFIWVKHENLQIQSCCLLPSKASMHACLLQYGVGKRAKVGFDNVLCKTQHWHLITRVFMFEAKQCQIVSFGFLAKLGNEGISRLVQVHLQHRHQMKVKMKGKPFVSRRLHFKRISRQSVLTCVPHRQRSLCHEAFPNMFS